MKKCIALLLCGVLFLSLLIGCGDSGSGQSETQKGEENNQEDLQKEDMEENGEKGISNYDETIPFTYTSYYSGYQMNSGVDYTQDPVYQYLLERFNIEPELWACEDNGGDEKMRTWVNTGSMPDLMWDYTFGLGSYYEYVDQGLLHALPDDWETRWPNIAYMVEATGMAGVLKVDGKTYAIPHAVRGLYTEYTEGNSLDTVVYYRKDLAKQVGLDDFGSGNIATKSELKEYLEKVKELQTVSTILECADGCVLGVFYATYGMPYDRAIIEEEDGFKFTPEADKDLYEQMLTELQGWYQEGLIDTDYFSKGFQDSVNSFVSGQAAALCYPATLGDIMYIRNTYGEAVEDGSREDVGLAYITADDGTISSTWGYNYWSASVFNPDTDEKTLERMLDLTDYLCSKEGATSLFCGVPEVEWEYDDNGEIRLLEGNIGDRDVLYSAFGYLGWCADENAYTGIGVENAETDIADAKFVLSMGPNAVKTYRWSENYDTHKSELKSNYSFPMNGKIKEIICSNVDVESTWNDHVEEYRNLWEPLVNELNETYGY